MGQIFYIIGKSASGKDTIYKRLLEDPSLKLTRITPYTTRPMREGEIPGQDYYFIIPEDLEVFRRAGKVIESRTYATAHGPWTYATIDDGNLGMAGVNYLGVGVLQSYMDLRAYFGPDVVRPIYIEVEDGERLQRALDRTRSDDVPRYKELCRRFLTDSEDFSEEKLLAAGIERRFENDDLEWCLGEIRAYIAGEEISAANEVPV